MEGIGAILFGVYFTLIGFGKVAISKNAESNADWLSRYGKLFKIFGPIFVVGGAIRLLLN
jgi:hypothetical protein